MKKKILFIINSLKAGGAEKILVDLLKGFDYEKFDVSLIYFVKGGVYLQDIPKQVHVKYVVGMGSRIENQFRKVLLRLNFLDNYYRWCIRRASGKYDTIVSYLEGFPTRMHSYILDKANKNITFVHTDLETYPDSAKQFAEDNSQESVYSKMDNIIFVSKHAKLAFESVYPDVEVQKIVLTNFIDINGVYNKSTAEKIEKRGFTVVTVGRLAEVKGVDIIPLVAKELRSRGYNIYFNIVGSGTEEQKIKELINENHVNDIVTLFGFKKNPYPYILAADVYLNVSRTEGMPLSLCEAMALGKPVVATNTSGAVELLGYGNGIIVERNVSIIIDAIINLYKDDSLRSSLAKKGVSYSSQFDMAKYINKLYNLI